MATAQATGIMSMLADKVYLPASTTELAAQFKNAAPFPHLVLDNLFPEDVVNGVLNEIPTKRGDNEKWFHEDYNRLTKSNLRSAVYLEEAGYQFSSFVSSARFLYLMTELTGVKALLPDPYLGGGGYHVVPMGGKFDVHADRNIDQVTGLRRRLAMLIYLNKDWKTEYGGQLELWSTDGARCERVIEPIFNRTVIFEVADVNFHGVRPVTDPNVSRKAFVSYYHTVPNPDLIPHNTIYAPNFYVKRQSLRRRFMDDYVPSVLTRAIRNARRKYK